MKGDNQSLEGGRVGDIWSGRSMTVQVAIYTAESFCVTVGFFLFEFFRETVIGLDRLCGLDMDTEESGLLRIVIGLELV